jgi:hypothetical protein
MYHMPRTDGPRWRSWKGENTSEETEVWPYFAFPLSPKLAGTTAKLSNLVTPTHFVSDSSRRPVLEEPPARTPIANRAPNPPPPPPMPAQAPVAIPIHMPGGNDAPAPTPGPTPASLRGAPRIVAAGPITLPPGYVLPPGWAVIPAQNVQVVPSQQAQIAAGAQNATGAANIHIGGPQGINGVPGPMPNAAGTPGGTGDVTGSNPITAHDHVNPTGPTTTRQDNHITINTSTAVPPNNSNISNNMTTTNATASHPMPRQVPRNWHGMSAHPAFPVTIPLFAMPGNMGVQHRPAPVHAAVGRTDGVSTSAATQSTPRVNGVGPADESESDERITLLNQMNETMSTMQNLVSRMSTLIPQSNLSSMPAAEPTIQAPQNSPSTTNTALISIDTSTSATLNGSVSTSPPRTPPKTPTSVHLHKRRSFSPIERTNENESSPNPLRRISTSEDELAPEELADIHAPWVEQDVQDGLQSQDIHSLSKSGSPPHTRSPSRSPGRTLRRRGSLLKHDITDEMLHDRGRDKTRNTDEFETATYVGGSSVDKGKGKEVFVEDVSDEG